MYTLTTTCYILQEKRMPDVQAGEYPESEARFYDFAECPAGVPGVNSALAQWQRTAKEDPGHYRVILRHTQETEIKL